MKRKIETYVHRSDAAEVEPDSAPGPYYVSVRDGERFALLLGPFETHREALAMVEPVRVKAVDFNRFAHFYSFGTCRVKSEYRKPGRLNRCFE